MKLPNNSLTIGIVVVVILGGGYLYFFSGSSQAPVSATPPAGAAEQQFLTLAGELQPLSFDTSILSDPRFASLVDISVPVTEDAQGRTDPFAPIPGVAKTPVGP